MRNVCRRYAECLMNHSKSSQKTLIQHKNACILLPCRSISEQQRSSDFLHHKERERESKPMFERLKRKRNARDRENKLHVLSRSSEDRKFNFSTQVTFMSVKTRVIYLLSSYRNFIIFAQKCIQIHCRYCAEYLSNLTSQCHYANIFSPDQTSNGTSQQEACSLTQGNIFINFK